jgi:hypothetical protein
VFDILTFDGAVRVATIREARSQGAVSLAEGDRQGLRRAACIQIKYSKHYVLIVAIGYPMLEEGAFDERRS